VEEGVLEMSEAVSRLTIQPAEILGIDAGQLSVGSVADICIFDPKHHWRIEEELIVSKGKNTPFLGWELSGKVSYTLLEGKIVYQAAQQVAQK
jgi:dihydroorotase